MVDRTETRPRIVRVPVTDARGEAYQEALARELELNPRHAAIVQRIESTAEQLHHGKKIIDRDQGKGPAIGWSD